MSAPPLDPAPIFRTGMGFFQSRTLLSAVELGVFTALGGERLTEAELCRRVGLHRRAAADFLDALVALGFLAREGDGAAARYANTPETAAFLDRASPSYVGSILAMAGQRLYRHWADLTEALRTGSPQNETKGTPAAEPFAALYADPARLVQFVDAMASRQAGNFRLLAERFDFGRFGTVCDVGGASGACSIAIARRHQAVCCISYDLAPVTAVARERIAMAGLAGRVEARAGDFMAETLPPADVVLMGNILHDWDAPTKRMLIGKVREALRPGGAFIAIEDVIDDARRANAVGLLMSLNMLIETPGGSNFTFSEFAGWCREGGFARTEALALEGTSSAAIAWT